VVYGCFWSSSTQITEDVKTKIVHTPWNFIFSMRQGVFCFLCLK
jgi:hypothetical protein